MGTIETLAAKLAEDTLAVMDATGEERLYVEIGNVLAAASQTLEEAFLTEIRVRLAERSARAFLLRRARELRAQAQTRAQARDRAAPARDEDPATDPDPDPDRGPAPRPRG